MRALRCHTLGNLDALEVEEVPSPPIGLRDEPRFLQVTGPIPAALGANPGAGQGAHRGNQGRARGRLPARCARFGADACRDCRELRSSGAFAHRRRRSPLSCAKPGFHIPVHGLQLFPAPLAQFAQGAAGDIYISDDYAGAIYRVTASAGPTGAKDWTPAAASSSPPVPVIERPSLRSVELLCSACERLAITTSRAALASPRPRSSPSDSSSVGKRR